MSFVVVLISRLVGFVCLYASMRSVLSSDDYYGYGTDWLRYIDESGSAHDMNFSMLPDYNSSWAYGRVYFYLYTRKNPDHPESLHIPDQSGEIKSEYFDASHNIKVLTHGWLSSGNASWIQSEKAAYLNRDDLNVIIVDWEELAKNPAYPWSAISTRYVGKRLAKLLDSLVETYQASGEQMHLIGHSLGGHVMGFAGMFFSRRLRRITGLDPARPLFEIPPMSDDCRLDESDAEFVDIIHTDAGVYGYEQDHGKADYYPNGGKPPQPGCAGTREAKDSCSHGRAYEFFIESIGDGVPFTSWPCGSYQEFEDGQCTTHSTYMGNPANESSRRQYYLHTRNESKYAKGDD